MMRNLRSIRPIGVPADGDDAGAASKRHGEVAKERCAVDTDARDDGSERPRGNGDEVRGANRVGKPRAQAVINLLVGANMAGVEQSGMNQHLATRKKVSKRLVVAIALRSQNKPRLPCRVRTRDLLDAIPILIEALSRAQNG